MKFVRNTILLLAAIGGLVIGLGRLLSTPRSLTPALLPLPAKMETHKGVFELSSNSVVSADIASASAAGRLVTRLQMSYSPGIQLQVVPESTEPNFSTELAAGKIVLQTDSSLPGEAYRLRVAERSVTISASGNSGFQYGVETFLQLLPPAVFSSTNARPAVPWEIRGLEIQDAPHFKWRGLMLDVSRHFFDDREVRQILDLMVRHKLNTFHWHLTDDEGWRLEIVGHPGLTEKGAWRDGIGFGLNKDASTAYNAAGQYGGFYTQEQVRQVVDYAGSLGITVVPEIELPSHAGAALRVYPELLCEGEPYSPETGQGLIPTVFCAGKEETFKFLEQVLDEAIKLFPGQYIHIGGDEVPHRNWRECPLCQERIRANNLQSIEQLQAYFMKRVAQMVIARGRTPVAWSEAIQGGLPSGTVLMDWTGGASEAVRSGHQAVMSPIAYTYLNLYQFQNRAAEPRAIAGLLTLEKTYSFQPVPRELSPDLASRVLGVQANLWTEYIPSLPAAEYMLLPRLCAVSEVCWTRPELRSWRDFTRRLEEHKKRLKMEGKNFADKKF